MSCFPNTSDAVSRDHAVCVPLPVSVTVWSAASECTVSDADLSPVVVGWNVARTVQGSLGCRTLPATQSPESSTGCAKAPGSVPPGSNDTDEIVASTAPVLVIVDVRGALAGAAISRSPKASVASLRLSCASVPLPVSATLIGAALEVMWTVDALAPSELGSNATRTLQNSPASRVVAGLQLAPSVARGNWLAAPSCVTSVKFTVSVPEFVTFATFSAV